MLARATNRDHRLYQNCLAALAGAAIALIATEPARAEPAVGPGAQAEPPGPAAPAAAQPLQANPGQRRAVRGCTVGNDCRDPRAMLLEFELEAFPPPGAKTPWMDGDDSMGHDAVRVRGALGQDALDRGIGARALRANSPGPLELRPDLPWLAELELPDIPVHWDDRVVRYLEFYRDDPRGRAIMRGWLRGQGRFERLIRARLRDAGLPQALIFIAMIESSYDVSEYSRVGASGLWQFMPGTARIYGLRVDRWVDERNDPIRSTDAAILMFRDLYQRFGDWHLAFAAYNAGYGAVIRSIAKYNTNDFWQLSRYEAGLPWGSSLYVPKAIATAIVGWNRETLGYDDVDEADPHVFDTVTVKTSTAFKVLARAAGASESEIARLNPHLRRRRTPPDAANFVVRIPAGRRDVFAERFPQLEGEWGRHTAYVVKHGERFEDIATVHGISYGELLALNGMVDEAEIGGGMVVVVPRVSESDKARNAAVAKEDLYRSGVPEGADDDAVLIVPVPDASARIEGKRRWFYRVVAGDSLWSVSRAFDVGVDEVAGWNGLAPDAFLHARMVLQVWTTPDLDAAAQGIKLLDETRLHLVTVGSVEHIELTEGRVGRRRTIYTVKHGGSFADVGKIYGLSRWDVARINRKPADTKLGPGDQVIVYEVVDHTKSSRARRQASKARKKPASMR